MGKVSESLFDGLNHVIPMLDVSHIQRHWYSSDKERTKDNYRGIYVVTKHSTWDLSSDSYHNAAYIPAGDEAKDFLACWCTFRSELESEILEDLAV